MQLRFSISLVPQSRLKLICNFYKSYILNPDLRCRSTICLVSLAIIKYISLDLHLLIGAVGSSISMQGSLCELWNWYSMQLAFSLIRLRNLLIHAADITLGVCQSAIFSGLFQWLSIYSPLITSLLMLFGGGYLRVYLLQSIISLLQNPIIYVIEEPRCKNQEKWSHLEWAIWEKWLLGVKYWCGIEYIWIMCKSANSHWIKHRKWRPDK